MENLFEGRIYIDTRDGTVKLEKFERDVQDTANKTERAGHRMSSGLAQAGTGATKASTGIRGMATASKVATGAISTLGAAIKAAFLPLLGIAGIMKIFDVFKQATGKSSEMGRSLETLRLTMQSVNVEFEENIILQWTRVVSQSTGVLQSELIPALTVYVGLLKNYEQAAAFATLQAEIMNSGVKISADTLQELLSKLAAGQSPSEAITKLGISMKDAEGNTISAAEAIERLTDRYIGMASSINDNQNVIDSWNVLWEQTLLALEPIVDIIFNIASEDLPKLTIAIRGVARILIEMKHVVDQVNIALDRFTVHAVSLEQFLKDWDFKAFKQRTEDIQNTFNEMSNVTLQEYQNKVENLYEGYNESADEAAERTDRVRETLLDLARQLGKTKDEANDLANALENLNDPTRTLVTGILGDAAKIEELLDEDKGLPALMRMFQEGEIGAETYSIALNNTIEELKRLYASLGRDPEELIRRLAKVGVIIETTTTTSSGTKEEDSKFAFDSMKLGFLDLSEFLKTAYQYYVTPAQKHVRALGRTAKEMGVVTDKELNKIESKWESFYRHTNSIIGDLKENANTQKKNITIIANLKERVLGKDLSLTTGHVEMIQDKRKVTLEPEIMHLQRLKDILPREARDLLEPVIKTLREQNNEIKEIDRELQKNYDALNEAAALENKGAQELILSDIAKLEAKRTDIILESGKDLVQLHAGIWGKLTEEERQWLEEKIELKEEEIQRERELINSLIQFIAQPLEYGRYAPRTAGDELLAGVGGDAFENIKDLEEKGGLGALKDELATFKDYEGNQLIDTDNIENSRDALEALMDTFQKFSVSGRVFGKATQAIEGYLTKMVQTGQFSVKEMGKVIGMMLMQEAIHESAMGIISVGKAIIASTPWGRFLGDPAIFWASAAQHFVSAATLGAMGAALGGVGAMRAQGSTGAAAGGGGSSTTPTPDVAPEVTEQSRRQEIYINFENGGYIEDREGLVRDIYAAFNRARATGSVPD